MYINIISSILSNTCRRLFSLSATSRISSITQIMIIIYLRIVTSICITSLTIFSEFSIQALDIVHIPGPDFCFYLGISNSDYCCFSFVQVPNQSCTKGGGVGLVQLLNSYLLEHFKHSPPITNQHYEESFQYQ